MQTTSHITSIHSKQAAKITAIMAFVAVCAATWPLAGAAWAFSVHLPRKHFMILLFVPFFYALATYFLVGLGCALYNFAARTVGGLRIEVAHHTHHTEVAHDSVSASAEKPTPLRKVA
jgi:Ni/Fe-hydrogenase subunit HybB-like protein